MTHTKPKFEFSHSTDGSGKSFVTRIKVKGKNLGGVARWSSRISWRWSDVPDGGDPSFRFFTVEVMVP